MPRVGHARDLHLQPLDATNRRSGPSAASRPLRPSTYHGSIALRSSTWTFALTNIADHAGSGTRSAGANHAMVELDSRLARISSTTSRKSLRDEVRQHEAVVQRRVPIDERFGVRLLPEPGDTRPAAAVAAPGSSARAAAFRTPRNSTRPNRPGRESGENSLSMQNSERCVLPVPSTSRLRKTRSTIHGGDVAACRRLARTRSPVRSAHRGDLRRRAAPGSSGR